MSLLALTDDRLVTTRYGIAISSASRVSFGAGTVRVSGDYGAFAIRLARSNDLPGGIVNRGLIVDARTSVRPVTASNLTTNVSGGCLGSNSAHIVTRAGVVNTNRGSTIAFSISGLGTSRGCNFFYSFPNRVSVVGNAVALGWTYDTRGGDILNKALFFT